MPSDETLSTENNNESARSELATLKIENQRLRRENQKLRNKIIRLQAKIRDAVSKN